VLESLACESSFQALKAILLSFFEDGYQTSVCIDLFEF